jgi:L-fuculose-phosphate aldolase
MKNFNINETKENIIKICRLMHQKGYVAATDGNVSVKLGDNKFLITPSGLNKGFIKEADLVTIDSNGRTLKGKLKASSELLMHLKVYSARPDINAVVHAHPPHITAFSVAGISIPHNMLPEVVLTIGKIPTSNYATPSTPEVAEAIEKLIMNHEAIILDRHGSLTTGENLFSAYNKLEKIEHVAHIAFLAKSLGKVKLLNEDKLKKLTLLAKKLGIRKNFNPEKSK